MSDYFAINNSQYTKIWQKPGFLLFLIVIGFVATLWVPHIGEEPVYTITTLEMLYRDEWRYPIIYGSNYPRPPLFNWLMLLVLNSGIVKVASVLEVARSITFLATLFSALGVYLLSINLWKNKQLGILALFTYLSGDVLFRRGWLAYADPLFAAMVFWAMAALVISLQKERLNYVWLILACVFLDLGYLSKTYTAYVFYLTLCGYLFCLDKYRKKMFSLGFIGIHVLFVVLPLIWWQQNIANQHGAWNNLMYWVKFSLQATNPLAYLSKVTYFPIWLVLLMMPFGFVAMYSLAKTPKKVFWQEDNFRLCCWALLLGLLPYWLVPQDVVVRHFLPMFPWAALVIAYIIYFSKINLKNLTITLIFVTLILKIAITPWYYYQQNVLKGNAEFAAFDILAKTKGQEIPLYIADSSAKGLRVAVTIDLLNWPKAPIVVHRSILSDSYYRITTTPKQDESIVSQYYLERNWLYLVCKGQACDVVTIT